MRIVIAQLKHETNTFSPLATPLERFTQARPWQGREAYEALKGTGTATGAFIDLAEGAGAEIALPVAAQAAASGPVEQRAYETLVGPIVEAVAGGCDAVLLDLHGAMVTERFEDGEGELLSRLRRIAPKVPIGVAQDMRANLFPAAGKHATVLAGYQTHPHVDRYETGVRVGWAILALLNGTVRPTLAFGHRPMLAHPLRQSSLDAPNRDLQARAREMEADGALCASFFTGFPHADVPYAGVSAAVATDGDLGLARALCDELLDMAWQAREHFVERPERLERSIARATHMADGPVALLDHCDDAGAGGTMDTMAVLSAMLDTGMEGACAFGICDPQAVARMRSAGLGAEVTLALGGKLDMPGLRMKAKPRTVAGRVKHLSEGRVRNAGPMARGEPVGIGPSAVLDTGKIEIVVTSRPVEAPDVAGFHAVGIDPAAKRYVMLKSAVSWRAGLGDVMRAVVECAGLGVTTSDYSQLRFKRLRRPMYPLDPER